MARACHWRCSQQTHHKLHAVCCKVMSPDSDIVMSWLQFLSQQEWPCSSTLCNLISSIKVNNSWITYKYSWYAYAHVDSHAQQLWGLCFLLPSLFTRDGHQGVGSWTFAVTNNDSWFQPLAGWRRCQFGWSCWWLSRLAQHNVGTFQKSPQENEPAPVVLLNFVVAEGQPCVDSGIYWHNTDVI